MNGYPRFGWVDILRFQQSDEEVNTGIRVVVALYLYVTAHSIRDLEMAGPDINRAVEATRYQLIESDTVGAFAADDKHRD